MMSFGIRRRIYLGLGLRLPMLYFEYFMVNLIKEFELKVIVGKK